MGGASRSYGVEPRARVYAAGARVYAAGARVYVSLVILESALGLNFGLRLGLGPGLDNC